MIKNSVIYKIKRHCIRQIISPCTPKVLNFLSVRYYVNELGKNCHHHILLSGISFEAWLKLPNCTRMVCAVAYVFLLNLNQHGLVCRIVFVYIGLPIMILGIVTSALTTALFKRELETFVSTSFILSCIAVTDIGYLIFSLGVVITVSIKDMYDGTYQLLFMGPSPSPSSV